MSEAARIVLRPALAHEIEALEALCMRSKAYWGYDEAFMELCRPVLRVSQRQLEAGLVCVAERSGTIAGMVQVTCGPEAAELELMFVDPPMMGYGIGEALFRWAEQMILAAGVGEMRVLADPGARSFYERMGAVYIGDAPSDAIPSRRLPRLVRVLRD